MARTIEAIYENGVFRPVAPVHLEEGQRVQVYVADEPKELSSQQIRELIRELQEASSEMTDDDWNEIAKSWKRND